MNLFEGSNKYITIPVILLLGYFAYTKWVKPKLDGIKKIEKTG